jgi:hypothetical protein
MSASRPAPQVQQTFPSLVPESGGEEPEVVGGYLARAVIAPGVYYFGVVDILQKWTLDKKLERYVSIPSHRSAKHVLVC